MSGSSNQIAARELLAARKCYPPEALRRIEVAFLQYARLREPMRSEHPFQRPNWFFPGLDSAPWPDPGLVPALAQIEAHSAAICQELRTVLAQMDAVSTWNDGTPHHGSWQSLVLRYGSAPVPRAERVAPITCSVINALPGIGEMAMLSIIGPGTHISAHCGLHNFRWTAHLGVVVPKGDCAFRVADETRPWIEQRCLLFDDSFEHEAWNRTEGQRAVLLFDLWHPRLTTIEREILNRIANSLASLRSRVDTA